MPVDQHRQTLRHFAWIARGTILAAFFVLWKRFDFPAAESLKYCFSAWLILHGLLGILRPIARVLDRARTRAMIAVGIAKFLATLALPVLWKGLDIGFWRAFVACSVVYLVLHQVWRVLDRHAATQSGLCSATDRSWDVSQTRAKFSYPFPHHSLVVARELLHFASEGGTSDDSSAGEHLDRRGPPRLA